MQKKKARQTASSPYFLNLKWDTNHNKLVLQTANIITLRGVGMNRIPIINFGKQYLTAHCKAKDNKNCIKVLYSG